MRPSGLLFREFERPLSGTRILRETVRASLQDHDFELFGLEVTSLQCCLNFREKALLAFDLLNFLRELELATKQTSLRSNMA